jgi:hypothetical protein
MRLLPLLALLSIAVVLAGAEEVQPAGRAELDRLDREIGVVEGLLAEADQRLELNHATTLAMLDQTMRSGIANWTDWHPPLATPSSPQDMQTWYLRGLQDRHGFDVREPATPWQHQWMALREDEHRIYDRYAELRVALRHLQRLRERLARQLAPR